MTVHAARQAGVDWLLSFDNDNFTDFNPLDIIASAGPNQHVITLSCGYKTSPSAYAFSCVSRPTSAVDGPFSEVADAFGGGVLMIRNTVWKKSHAVLGSDGSTITTKCSRPDQRRKVKMSTSLTWSGRTASKCGRISNGPGTTTPLT